MVRRLPVVGLLTVVAAVVVALLVAWVGQRGDPPPGGLLSLGDSAVVQDNAGDKVRVTVKSATVRKLRCDSLDAAVLKGDFLVLEVSFTLLEGQWSADPYDFYYEFPQGATGTYAVKTPLGALGNPGDDCGSSLTTRPLRAGLSVTGTVLFSGPPPRSGELRYEPRTVLEAPSWALD